jgi:hypothetical protein
MLVVQYPRGAAAIVWLDPTTGAITTNHAGLQAMLRAGGAPPRGTKVPVRGVRLSLSEWISRVLEEDGGHERGSEHLSCVGQFRSKWLRSQPGFLPVPIKSSI